MGVSKNSAIPKWMVKIMENPMNKWIILGGTCTTILGNIHITTNFYGLVENPPHLSFPKAGVRCPLPFPKRLHQRISATTGRSEHWIDDDPAFTDGSAFDVGIFPVRAGCSCFC